jgi:hypothetical protein
MVLNLKQKIVSSHTFLLIQNINKYIKFIFMDVTEFIHIPVYETYCQALAFAGLRLVLVLTSPPTPKK